MVLQGFSKDVLAGEPDTLRVQGSGNAYPVPLMIAVLHPILDVIRLHLKKTTMALGLRSDAYLTACANFDKYMNHEGVRSEGGSCTRYQSQTNEKSEAYESFESYEGHEGHEEGEREVAGQCQEGHWKKQTIQCTAIQCTDAISLHVIVFELSGFPNLSKARLLANICLNGMETASIEKNGPFCIQVD